MTLFVSNPSRQVVEFSYRTEKSPTGESSGGPKRATIPSGGQIELGHGWSREQTDYVIEQIIRAGGANAAEAHGKMGKFTWLLYREHNPVDEDEIVSAHKSVVADAEERSVREATRGVLAFDRSLNKDAKRRGRVSKVTGVEVEQILPQHTRLTGDEVHFEMSVDPDGRSEVQI